MVLWIDRDPAVQMTTGYEYSTVLVYSCKENYLFHRVFESVQVFSRISDLSREKIDAVLETGRSLGLTIDAKNMHYRQAEGCVYPESLLPSSFVKK